MVKYKITSLLVIADGPALLTAVFPNWNGEPAWFDQSEIVVEFNDAQSAINLGPLVKVEQI
jgi:hypothetical protein